MVTWKEGWSGAPAVSRLLVAVLAKPIAERVAEVA
jgi:hypothetical protein